MDNACRMETPIEMFTRALGQVTTMENIVSDYQKILDDALCYEKHYYDNEYIVINGYVKELEQKVERLEKEREVLVEYMLLKERETHE